MVSVIILAAGSSSRMNGKNKQLELIGGVPVFVMSALKFQDSEKVGEIIISAPKGQVSQFEREIRLSRVTKLAAVTEGGNTRFLSMREALKKASGEFVAIHDGARPLIETSEIDRVIADAEQYGAAIAAVPATDTVKISKDGGIVESTPERSKLFYAQTPQIFRRELLLSCIERLGESAVNATDDSVLLELCGESVKLTEINCCNLKITRPADLLAAKAIFCKSGCDTEFEIK